jgi:hypothetical protein
VIHVDENPPIDRFEMAGQASTKILYGSKGCGEHPGFRAHVNPSILELVRFGPSRAYEPPRRFATLKGEEDLVHPNHLLLAGFLFIQAQHKKAIQHTTRLFRSPHQPAAAIPCAPPPLAVNPHTLTSCSGPSPASAAPSTGPDPPHRGGISGNPGDLFPY